MRLAAEVRSRTRCARRRSRSRSSRSSSEGIQSAGTRSRRHNSASTRASTRSVLHASGAIPFTRRASATSTCQPAERSRSRTHTAPLIISTHAFTSVPSRRTSLASPSSSADVNPSALIAPPTDFAHHAALRYAQSIPTYSVTRALLSVSDCVSKRPLSRAPGRPSFMTFSRQGPDLGWRMSRCGALRGGGDLRGGTRAGRRGARGAVGAVGGAGCPAGGAGGAGRGARAAAETRLEQLFAAAEPRPCGVRKLGLAWKSRASWSPGPSLCTPRGSSIPLAQVAPAVAQRAGAPWGAQTRSGAESSIRSGNVFVHPTGMGRQRSATQTQFVAEETEALGRQYARAESN